MGVAVVSVAGVVSLVEGGGVSVVWVVLSIGTSIEGVVSGVVVVVLVSVEAVVVVVSIGTVVVSGVVVDVLGVSVIIGVEDAVLSVVIGVVEPVLSVAGVVDPPSVTVVDPELEDGALLEFVAVAVWPLNRASNWALVMHVSAPVLSRTHNSFVCTLLANKSTIPFAALANQLPIRANILLKKLLAKLVESGVVVAVLDAIFSILKLSSWTALVRSELTISYRTESG